MSMKHLKKFNETFSGAEYTERSHDAYEELYSKFTNWLCGEKGFELYDGEEDFHKKFLEVSKKDTGRTSVEEKSTEIANYLENNWGLYDGYQEVVEYLEKLYFDEV